MKKSELTAFIKEEIKSSLTSEDTQQDIKDTEELTKVVADLAKAKEEAGLSEENIGLADIEEMGYEAGERAFEEIKGKFQNQPDHQAYKKGFFQGYIDQADAYGLNEAEDKGGNFAELKKYQKMLDDAAKFFREKADEYGVDVKTFGAFNQGINDLVDFVFKANNKRSGGKIDENEDKEPSKADLKKTKGLAKAKEELVLLTREMKSLAREYSKAEGEDKEKLVKTLKAKTKLKKELESILDNKKI